MQARRGRRGNRKRNMTENSRPVNSGEPAGNIRPDKKEKKRSEGSAAVKFINNFTTVLVVILVIMAVMLVGFRFVGFDTYVVLSGSMEPAHKTGSLIYAREANVDELQVGDVIMFQSQNLQTIVTHRIVDIKEDDGGRQFQTKGDANDAPDAQLVTEANVVGKASFSIPYMGYVANYIQNPPGLYFAAAGGVMLVLLMFISDALVEDEKKTLNKKKKAKKGEGQNEE